MRLFAIGLLNGFLVCGGAIAAAAPNQPPSDASIHELLEVTHARATFETLMSEMGGALQQPNLRSLVGPAIDSHEQEILEEQTKKLSDLRASQLTWASVEPIYVDLYNKSLSQADVDNMLAIFKTPDGQAAVTKLQAATMSSVLSMQGRMATVLLQEQKIGRDTSDLLKAYQAAKAPTPTSSTSGATNGSK